MTLVWMIKKGSKLAAQPVVEQENAGVVEYRLQEMQLARLTVCKDSRGSVKTRSNKQVSDPEQPNDMLRILASAEESVSPSTCT